MNIYLLTRIGVTDFESYEGFIMRASSETSARALAHAEESAYEVWLDPEKSSCKIITSEGKEEILLGDFNAG